MKFHHITSTAASFTLAIASITGLSGLALSSYLTKPAIAQETGEPVTTTSSTNAIGLAKHLRKTGAKLYTAYWCPHCHNQKERFGKEAVSQLDVIECDQRGVNPQTQLCIDKKIKGYPTWEIGGKFYGGNRTLENLAELSKYRSKLWKIFIDPNS
jgi:glutaredoxin